MRINPANKGTDYRDQFFESGTTVIRDFLVPEYAEKMHHFFNSEMPSDWWTAVTYPSVDGKVSYIRNHPQNHEVIQRDLQHANAQFGTGYGVGNYTSMVYHFYRTLGDHYDSCSCSECDLRKWILTPELLEFLEGVSGDKYSGANSTFTSKYSAGCFLSPHTDYSNGDIGFVLQLTKDWRSQWGGNLCLMDEAGEKVEQIETPTFNSLTLFRIVENNGRWHYVSHVNPGVIANRIAFTGWFTKEK
jgi:hypothetical protein